LNLNFGQVSGLEITIGQILGLTLLNFGYKSSFAGILGALLIVGGTIRSQINGKMLQ
jgi:hypothetical protein